MKPPLPKAKLLLQKVIQGKRATSFQGESSCGTCHLAGICSPDERCGVVVKVRERDGTVADVLCWPAEPSERAA